MKLQVNENAALEEVEVTISCPRIDGCVRRIIEAAQMEEHRFMGLFEGYMHVVDASDVLYGEAVDGKTFLYTEDKVLELTSSLADLEVELAGTEFVRISRSMLVNLMHVVGLRPYLNARLDLLLDNDEHVIASRQYAPAIKKRIGL